MTRGAKGVGLACEILLHVFGNEKQVKQMLKDVGMIMLKYRNKMQYMQAKPVMMA